MNDESRQPCTCRDQTLPGVLMRLPYCTAPMRKCGNSLVALRIPCRRLRHRRPADCVSQIMSIANTSAHIRRFSPASNHECGSFALIHFRRQSHDSKSWRERINSCTARSFRQEASRQRRNWVPAAAILVHAAAACPPRPSAGSRWQSCPRRH